MTLRLRLVLVLISLVAAGLLVSDVFTFTSLRSDLTSQLDSQLQGATGPVTRALLATAGEASSGGQPFGVGQGVRPGNLVPPGTFGELRDASGKVVATDFFTFGGATPPQPNLPTKLPGSGASPANGEYFTATSGGSVSYRVFAIPLTAQGGTVIIAIPLTSQNATLHDLFLVELLVSLGVILALGALTWWAVRHGLRPLEEIAETADTIAGGDLSQRIQLDHPDTEVGRLGSALNSMLGEIEEAFAARAASEARLRRFLADASHELRTPLTAIRGFSEMFDRGAAAQPEDLEMSMHHIRAEADRMAELVEELLLLARLDRERPLDLQPVAIAEVATTSVDAARAGQSEATSHPITVEVPEDPRASTVIGDANRLRRVIDNLVTNALQHTPPGTPVVVRVRREPDHVVLEVADRGPGIAPEDRARIFEPFRRADPSRARSTGGTGLGLAIVAAIVRAHGGSVGVDTRPDATMAAVGSHGDAATGGAALRARAPETLFWVHIPVSATPQPLAGRDPEAGGSTQAGGITQAGGSTQPTQGAHASVERAGRDGVPLRDRVTRTVTHTSGET